MTRPDIQTQRPGLAVPITVSWIFIAVIVGVQNFLSARFAGRPTSIGDAMLWHLPILFVWAAATPLIFRSVKRWPFLGNRWMKHLPIHALLGIVFVLAVNAAWPVLYPSQADDLSMAIWLTTTAANVTKWLPLALMVYFAIAAIGHLVYRPSRTSDAYGGDPAPGIRKAEYPEHVTIRGLNRSFLVPAADIEWIEASGDHVIYHVGDKALKERRRLKDVQRGLDPRRFVRVHRSTIAQVACIREMHTLEHGDFLIVMHGGARIRLTRSRRKALETALGRSL